MIFYPAAKIIIRHPSDSEKILLIQRKGYYEPAGGRIEIDFTKKIAETVEQCVIREAQEELGLTAAIDRYIGSYYFFWSIDATKASSCVVFDGTIISQDPDFVTNADSHEVEIMPAWVSLNDIITKTAPIDPLFCGLEKLMINLEIGKPLV